MEAGRIENPVRLFLYLTYLTATVCLAGGVGVIKLQAGRFANMALTATGQVWCWGTPPVTDVLGLGHEGVPSMTPQLVPALNSRKVMPRCSARWRAGAYFV